MSEVAVRATAIQKLNDEFSKKALECKSMKTALDLKAKEREDLVAKLSLERESYNHRMDTLREFNESFNNQF